MSTMTLIQQLRGRAAFLRDKGRIKSPGLMEEAANALEAHLAQPAQAVDVGAIREVIGQMGEASIEAMARDAESWRLCTSDHVIGGETIKCHVNVGVNVWRGEEWMSFHSCSPDELREALNMHAAMRSAKEDGNE